MKVFSIANQKGGVGKTTTAVNLATGLAAVGKRVLLIDLDSQGNASTAFSITPEQRNPSTYELMVDENVKISDTFIETQIPNLIVSPATVDLSACDVELAGKISREYILRNKLQEVKDDFEYVIIDCPPSLGLLTINALTASGHVLVPLQCEFYSLEGLSYLMNTIELVSNNLNDDIDIGGVLLTMYDRRNKLTRDVENEVREFFGDKVFKTLIPRNVKLSEAPSHGVPGIIYDHRSTGARAYMMLAREMLERFG